MKVFLGGTCNESTWRDELIPMLNINYFNPIVDDWTLECIDEEIRQCKDCDFVLYVITPEMTGVYSIAEVVDSSNKYPEKTIFCYMQDHKSVFTYGQIKSLEAVQKMIIKNGGKCFVDLKYVASYLNNTVPKKKKMTNNIVRLGPHSRMTVEQSLNYTLNENFQNVLIIGYDEDGMLSIYSSEVTREEALFLTMKTQEHIMGWGE